MSKLVRTAHTKRSKLENICPSPTEYSKCSNDVNLAMLVFAECPHFSAFIIAVYG